MANFKERFINALLGAPSNEVAPIELKVDYGKDLQGYMDTLPQQDYAKGLFARKDLTTPQINEGIANGLNFGVPQIAEKQKELGIRIPQTGAEKDLAQVGQFNSYPIVSSIQNSPREGGFLRDLASGFKENLNEGFDVDNLEPDKNKGFATRLGEGLGTLTRFYNKPIGRMAVATGLSLLTGEANPLGEGVKAYVGRQNNMTKDKAYRQNLVQMGYEQEDVDQIPGILTDQVYSNLIRAQQLRDNAEYRNMLLKKQEENTEAQRLWQMAQAERQAKQDAMNNYYKGQSLAQGWAKIANDRDKPTSTRIMPASSATALSGTQQGINQMETLMEQIPKYAKLGLAGPIGSLKRFNPYDADAQAFQQYVNTYKQVIGKGLEGGVLRKEDEAKYEKIIPRMGDTEEVLMRKAQQLQKMLIGKYNTDLESLYNAGYNTGNFNYYGSQANAGTSNSDGYAF